MLSLLDQVRIRDNLVTSTRQTPTHTRTLALQGQQPANHLRSEVQRWPHHGSGHVHGAGTQPWRAAHGSGGLSRAMGGRAAGTGLCLTQERTEICPSGCPPCGLRPRLRSWPLMAGQPLGTGSVQLPQGLRRAGAQRRPGFSPCCGTPPACFCRAFLLQ